MMEENVVSSVFGPWLIAARERQQVTNRTELKAAAETADAAVIGMTRAANELEAVQSTLQTTAQASELAELAEHRQTLEERIEAVVREEQNALPLPLCFLSSPPVFSGFQPINLPRPARDTMSRSVGGEKH
jgi:hypothetical protein